jgi:hypothetical protein
LILDLAKVHHDRGREHPERDRQRNETEEDSG